MNAGGYSWFAPVRGFVCDSVVNYQLVDANGDIINANKEENSDLYLALKGGSNNFGIVTRYDMEAFPQGDLWGGLMIYPESTWDAQIAAFVNFTNYIKNDTHANMINI
jgi:FAD/FMN-containing dehydrogenase